MRMNWCSRKTFVAAIDTVKEVLYLNSLLEDLTFGNSKVILKWIKCNKYYEKWTVQ